MKITYLGTAAAEGMPAVFCNCETCMAARKAGGKNIRTRSQMLINEDLLLDFPMDTYFHALRAGLDLSKIKNVYITHAHMDHCYPGEFVLHGAPYAHNMSEPIITVHGNKTVTQLILAHNAHEMKPEIQSTVILSTIEPYKIIERDGYRITALPAVHTIGEDCLIYMIEQGSKATLMFNDSGVLPDSVYEYLASTGKQLDFISFDCTYGLKRNGKRRHMGLLDNADERERMAKFNLLKDSTVYVATHFSHNGGMLHDEFESHAKKLGFMVAYDGLEIEI